ncbi:MAG: hypothetical protein F6K50_09730 [Moorea sp. SIO3I7]|uniref:hypothetical protein n=1 Tax=Moorena sp. SIO3I8 TaxID=2607833 RepID=UPI0013BF4B0A|nr:hypothetical protein [Moorena sp. SIO3I8]NEN95797.1 hypothetical protein [Moorena sp. SIO3I7]NEO09573.1 hypothetical protein [Moorena sp. SIO3I8]
MDQVGYVKLRLFALILLSDSRFPIPDSRFPIPDSRFPIPDSRFFTTSAKSHSIASQRISTINPSGS